MNSPPTPHHASARTGDGGKTGPVVALPPGSHGQVAALLQHYAAREILLWRTPEDILAHAQDFLVTEDDNGITGCVALHDYGSGLYEIRSLAVTPAQTGRGLGGALVGGCIDRARARGGNEVFALTRQVDFFVHLGFRQVDRERFPDKVWRDCRLCPHRDCCDETAVALTLA